MVTLLVRRAGCPSSLTRRTRRTAFGQVRRHDRGGLAGDLELLVGRDDEDVHPAGRAGDPAVTAARGEVGLVVDLDAEDAQAVAYRGAQPRGVLTDARRENHGVEPAERRRIRPDVLAEPV